MKNLILLGLITLFHGRMSGQNMDSLSIYPNPYSTQFNTRFFLYAPDTVDYKIYDVNGRIVYEPYSHQALPAGIHNYNLANDTLEEGIYFHYVSQASGNGAVLKITKTEPASISDFSPITIPPFPNPSNDVVTLPFEKILSLKIYSTDGKLLREIGHPEQKYNVSSLPVGIYIFQINTENHRPSTFQVVKQ